MTLEQVIANALIEWACSIKRSGPVSLNERPPFIAAAVRAWALDDAQLERAEAARFGWCDLPPTGGRPLPDSRLEQARAALRALFGEEEE